jgi:hypothetical protein
MTILIYNDFYISNAFQNKALIDQSVIDLFQQADYRIINLKAPSTVTELKYKLLKPGLHLCLTVETIKLYLKQLKVDAVNSYKNIILEYGAKGFRDSFESVKQN